MKKLVVLIIVYFFLLETFPQTIQDVSVELSAVVQNNPIRITLNWFNNGSATGYTIYRKLKTDLSWGASIATLGASINTYADNSVTLGTNYEYKVVRAGAVTGYGYINSGIEVPAIESRGKIILLVDSTFTVLLASELIRLKEDLEGDGWMVIKRSVLRTATVPFVRSVIMAAYNLDPANTKALFIIGHVPVPYSGNLNPDGHSSHKGAWATDMYYGDVNGSWTDATVTAIPVWGGGTPNLPSTNVPGDGKFDQSSIPNDMELQVGRVDLFDMPTFSSSEVELLRNYFNKDHNYRHKVFTTTRRALIDDNFGYLTGWAPAANGFKNFGPLVGFSNVASVDYVTSMTGNSYLWSYGCGGGSWVSANGVGSTTDFATKDLKGVFTMLFGSYFGDWDITDNFTRAPLGGTTTLTNVWAGNTHWQFHHMGLGENIGYSVITTQNNPGSLYYQGSTSYTGRYVHNNLMGDPSLRNDIVKPVTNVVATKSGNNCNISWTASTESNVIGYNIYMKNETNTSYVKLNSSPVIGTTYSDNNVMYKGILKYMVRTIILQTSPSGTYYNMSEGITDTANFLISVDNSDIKNTISNVEIYPNPTTDYFTVKGINDNYKIVLYDVYGRNVLQQLIYLNNYKVDISVLTQGVYFYAIIKDNKIIKSGNLTKK